MYKKDLCCGISFGNVYIVFTGTAVDANILDTLDSIKTLMSVAEIQLNKCGTKPVTCKLLSDWFKHLIL